MKWLTLILLTAALAGCVKPPMSYECHDWRQMNFYYSDGTGAWYHVDRKVCVVAERRLTQEELVKQ